MRRIRIDAEQVRELFLDLTGIGGFVMMLFGIGGKFGKEWAAIICGAVLMVVALFPYLVAILRGR